MNFVVDAWQPVVEEQIHAARKVQSGLGDLKFRHYLVLGAIPLFFVGSPLAWLASGEWAAATLCAGVAGLLVTCASLLAPDSNDIQSE